MGRVKTVVQGLFERHPALKRNGLYYRIQHYRQTRPLRVDYDLAPEGSRDLIATLDRDGVVVIPDFVPRDVCERMLDDYQPHFERVLDGTFDDICNREPKYGAYRIGNAERYSTDARIHFFDNDFIRRVAHAFVSPTAFSYRREADFKVHEGAFMQSDLPHFDDWRHRFKAFLYLTDCGEDNAPFVYYPGTQRQDDGWKDRYYREYEVDGPEGRYGHFFPYEWDVLSKKHGFRERVCTGSAGTLIFGDFRGVHRGQPLKKGRRVMLNNTFGIALPGVL